MPVEIESRTVSHFKATINATVKPEGLESDGIFISYQARPKIVHLLHKRGFVYSDMHTTVPSFFLGSQISMIFLVKKYLLEMHIKEKWLET